MQLLTTTVDIWILKPSRVGIPTVTEICTKFLRAFHLKFVHYRTVHYVRVFSTLSAGATEAHSSLRLPSLLRLGIRLRKKTTVIQTLPTFQQPLVLKSPDDDTTRVPFLLVFHISQVKGANTVHRQVKWLKSSL